MAQAGLTRAAGALCFATTAHGAAFHLILRTVAHEAATREVAGCSSLGVIAAENEIESGPAVSVLVFGGGGLSAKRLFVPSARGGEREAALEFARGASPASGGSSLLCVFPDTYNIDPDPLLTTLEAELPGVTIVGGGASEDGSIGETFQFCGDTVSSNSIAGMLISGEFDLNAGVSLACTQVGRLHRVTAARGNVIATLDDRPAYEVFAEAAGPLADDPQRARAFIFVGIPLDPQGERLERGRYLVRNILGVSPEHGIIVVAHALRVGDRLGFTLRSAERAREDLKAMLEELSARPMRPPAFGLYFDCVARGSGLYNLAGHDSAYIRRYLGPVPVAGFFTGFEFGPAGGASGLHQYSGVLVLLSEKAG